MVSRATKRFWKSVAIGLALTPVLAVENAVLAQSPAPTISAVKGEAGAAKPANDIEAVRQLVRDGRKALKDGDKARAEKLARQALAMKVTMPFYETDTPEKLLMEIGVKATPPAAAAPATGDPKGMVKQGYDALKAGNLDEAQRLGTAASAVRTAKWGLFDDTPTKLLDDVQKARTAKNKTESVKVLADARKAFEAGKLEDAEKLAYKASTLHGPYSLWDLGDRPEKLIAEVATAKDRQKKSKVPAVPGTATAVAAKAKANDKPAGRKPEAVAAKPAAKKPEAVAAKPADSATPKPVAPVQMATAKPAQPIDMATAKPAEPNAMPMPVVAQVTPPAPNWPTEVATADVKAPSGEVTTAAATVPQNAPSAVVQVKAEDVQAKAKATALVNEGRALQTGGRFLEARAKYAEAQKCGVEFGPTEISPDGCMIDLAAAVTRQIDLSLREAQAPMATPEKARECEARLKASREMAAGFGLDTQPIDAFLALLASATGKPAAPPAPTVADTMVQGQNLLEKCRMELKRGQCETARQLANEVYNGNYGLQNEAVSLLRNIDVEEHNQRVLATNRNFDAAMAAFRTKDMATCQAVLRQCDANLLSPDKRNQMKEVLLTAQKVETPVVKAPAAPAIPPAAMPAADMGMKPAEATPGPIQQVAATGKPAAGVQQASAPAAPPATPAMKPASEGDSLAAQVQAMQQIEYQRLRAEGLEVQSKAMSQFERGETDAAMETLEAYSRKLKGTKLDSASVDRLQRPIDARVNSFKLLRAEKEFQNNVVKKKDRFQQEMSKAAEAEMKKQGQIKDLMKQFNALYKDGKYKEAEVAAAKAHELDPDDPSTEAALKLAQIHGRTTEYDRIQNDKEAMVRKGLNDAEKVGPAVDMEKPLAVDAVTLKLAKGREKDKNGISMRSLSEKEKEISGRMMKSVNVSFTNVPLRQCLDDLRATTGLNIYTDLAALQAESVSADQPITVKADNISLKAAMNLILSQAHLTHVIQDEVLKVTTEKAARGKLTQRVFSVADLVIPIDDYMLPTSSNLQASMDRVTEQQRVNLNGSNTPFTNMRNGLPNGTAVGSGSNGPLGVAAMRTQPEGANGVQPGNVGSPMSYSSSVAPTKQTMQDMLIKLITNTVAPDSWAAVGGSGTIDYMPIGLALVINQTPDVQEQVVDLLEALRRLQDLEVAVEVRIITLAETFFERIGLDFALNIKTDKGTEKYEPQLVTNQFKPAGQINDFSPQRFLAGIRPGGVFGQAEQPGSFTSDLDIPIRSSSFAYGIPPFAYPNNPGFNGGLSLGLAFLSDIQVYMFMEAAQGDRRTNVMQAPKLTLFNGQTATLTVSDQQFFVTNVNVVGFGGQIVFVPQNNAFPLGVNLTIQAVVSADRRFVRLNIAPTLSNLASAIVPLFPVTTFITPVFEGGAQGQPIPFTQFIQQPQFSTVTIQTTVAVPDGGTVIMGGLKTLSEGRNEFGPPVLSKLPYVNRLFKNVGYGREAQSLLLMVTPRIIINAEEEERQTGYTSTPPVQ